AEEQELAPVAQRGGGQQADLRDGVEDDALRPPALQQVEDHLEHLVQLDLAGRKDRLLQFSLRQGGEVQLVNPAALQRPTVAGRRLLQLLCSLRQREVEHVFPLARPRQQKVQ